MRSTPEVIAHRGASLSRPEHTLEAYDLALAQGADTLELDLRATRDGHVVVLHDATLARTHGDRRAIADVALRDAPRPLLTLGTVLARYGGRVGLLLELKGPGAPVEATLAQAAGVPGVVLQSFDRLALRRAWKRCPELPVAPLFLGRPSARQLDRAAGYAEGVGVPHGVADAALVGAAHARGLRVRAWTANRSSELDRLTAAGVDGLITDAPDRAVAVRATAAAFSALAA